jgi:hypothetical protein
VRALGVGRVRGGQELQRDHAGYFGGHSSLSRQDTRCCFERGSTCLTCTMRCLLRARRKTSIAPVPPPAKIQVASSPMTRALAGADGSSTARQSRPEHAAAATASSSPTTIKTQELAGVLYHWATCVFIVGLVCSRLLGAVWDTQTSTMHLVYGRSPLLGPSQIVGTNDVPYPDRVIACVRDGDVYIPKLVSSLLAAPGVSATLEDSTGAAMHGYRLRQRRVGSVSDALDSAAQDVYEESCNLIAKTMANIFDACLALGYTNLTRDSLRVVDDWDSKKLYLLPNTLPVLIIPYWDNAPHARHAVPTWGGDACIFRLEDAYSASDSASVMASFRGVNQSVRHERTVSGWIAPEGIGRTAGTKTRRADDGTRTSRAPRQELLTT